MGNIWTIYQRYQIFQTSSLLGDKFRLRRRSCFSSDALQVVSFYDSFLWNFKPAERFSTVIRYYFFSFRSSKSKARIEMKDTKDFNVQRSVRSRISGIFSLSDLLASKQFSISEFFSSLAGMRNYSDFPSNWVTHRKIFAGKHTHNFFPVHK